MAKSVEYIIRSSISKLIKEAPELDNAPVDAKESMFTPAEKSFLGKFDARGTTHIGIIYSTSDAGIQEFLMRTGKDLNLSREMLDKFINDGIIEIAPYGGYGNDTNYTLQLNLSLDDINGFGDDEKEKLEAGTDASGAPAPGGEEPPMPEPTPGPENAWVVRYGDIISESVKIATQLITEKTKSKTTKTKSTVHVKQSRELNLLPKGFINQLERIIDMINMKAKTKFTKQRVIADILDNLAINLDLTTDQIQKAYIYHRNQKKLNKLLNKK
jgi:hypothetical protein